MKTIDSVVKAIKVCEKELVTLKQEVNQALEVNDLARAQQLLTSLSEVQSQHDTLVWVIK